MTPKTSEFKKLQDEWYGKLKDEGFKDIEQADGNLKTWDDRFFRMRHDPILFEAKEEYYRMASKFLHDHKFDNPLEKAIWELYAQGLSVREVSKKINKSGKHTTRYGKKLNKDSVNTITKKLTKIMLEAYGKRN